MDTPASVNANTTPFESGEAIEYAYERIGRHISTVSKIAWLRCGAEGQDSKGVFRTNMRDGLVIYLTDTEVRLWGWSYPSAGFMRSGGMGEGLRFLRAKSMELPTERWMGIKHGKPSTSPSKLRLNLPNSTETYLTLDNTLVLRRPDVLIQIARSYRRIADTLTVADKPGRSVASAALAAAYNLVSMPSMAQGVDKALARLDPDLAMQLERLAMTGVRLGIPRSDIDYLAFQEGADR